MRFLIDAMLPPEIADQLNAAGYDAVTPSQLGAHNLPAGVLVQIVTAEDRVIVTENASDSAQVASCTVARITTVGGRHLVASGPDVTAARPSGPPPTVG